jgi:uncharacterized coiled-coil protein SlyX
MHPDYTPPIRPLGTNSLESRIKALEVAQAYDVRDFQILKEQVRQISQQMYEERNYIERLIRKLAVWLISSLIASVAALLLIVVKIKAPWLISP